MSSIRSLGTKRKPAQIFQCILKREIYRKKDYIYFLFPQLKTFSGSVPGSFQCRTTGTAGADTGLMTHCGGKVPPSRASSTWDTRDEPLHPALLRELTPARGCSWCSGHRLRWILSYLCSGWAPGKAPTFPKVSCSRGLGESSPSLGDKGDNTTFSLP